MAKRVQRQTKDARLKSEARRDRHEDNREIADDRVLQDAERLNEFRQQFFQSVLPDLPKIPGYHTVWLTTSNPQDPISRRMRLGYEPVKASDIPGWESLSLKTGEYAGCIGVNEMIAFKIPLHLYEAFMREVHHDQPWEEEEKLGAVVDVIEEAAARDARSGGKGIKIEVEDGMAELGQDRVEAPVFSKLTGEA